MSKEVKEAAPTPLSEKLSALADKLDRVAQAVTVIKDQVVDAVAEIRAELKGIKSEEKKG